MSAPEYSGRTVDEAVKRALAELGVAREQVNVDVIQEPRQALLGLGGREARVRVALRATPGPFAQKTAEEILSLMGYEATASLQESQDALAVTLSGRELGALIGRHGRTLDALEFLLGLHVARQHGRRIPVVLDAEGYRARREKALRDIAQQAAERAANEGEPVRLDPMEPRDRRSVHLALQDDTRVTTSSEGEDDQRCVVVHPREKTSPAE